MGGNTNTPDALRDPAFLELRKSTEPATHADIGRLMTSLIKFSRGVKGRLDRLEKITDGSAEKTWFDEMLEAHWTKFEQRVALLERSFPRFEGDFEKGRAYTRGSFVTYAGSLWHCEEACAYSPGNGPAWRQALRHNEERSE